MERLKTGIPGFDEVSQGGFLSNSVNLISGGTGTGKTIFCLQFLWNGISKFKEDCMYISLEESEESLLADAKSFGWDFSSAKKSKCTFSYIPPYSIRDFESGLVEKILRTKSKRVVIDSITSLGMALEDNFERRKSIYRLAEQLKKLDCVALLTSEIPHGSSISSEGMGRLSRFGVEEFACDSVVMFHYAGLGGLSDRAIQIVKMRRTKHARGPMPMEIGKNGIKILYGKKGYM